MAEGQSNTGSLTNFLGRKKRLEYACRYGFRNTGSIIGDPDDYFGGSRIIGRFKRYLARFTAGSNRLLCVDDEIDDDLCYLIRISIDQR